MYLLGLPASVVGRSEEYFGRGKKYKYTHKLVHSQYHCFVGTNFSIKISASYTMCLITPGGKKSDN